MKKILYMLLLIMIVVICLTSCSEKIELPNISTTTGDNISALPQGTTAGNIAVSTTEQAIYSPEPDYANKYDGYIMTAGDNDEHIGYVPSWNVRDLNGPSSKTPKTFEYDEIQYNLIWIDSTKGAYADYYVDTLYACRADIDKSQFETLRQYKKQSTLSVRFIRGTDKVVGVRALEKNGTPEFYLGEMDAEKEKITEESLILFAKKMATEFVKTYDLDFNIDECHFSFEESRIHNDGEPDWYYFSKYLDGVPTNEYIRVYLNKYGKCSGFRVDNVGMFDEFENAKIDTEAIAMGWELKSMTLINDNGRLVAENKREEIVKSTPEEIEGGFDEYRTKKYTWYVPLVAKEIENKE